MSKTSKQIQSLLIKYKQSKNESDYNDAVRLSSFLMDMNARTLFKMFPYQRIDSFKVGDFIVYDMKYGKITDINQRNSIKTEMYYFDGSDKFSHKEIYNSSELQRIYLSNDVKEKIETEWVYTRTFEFLNLVGIETKLSDIQIKIKNGKVFGLLNYPNPISNPKLQSYLKEFKSNKNMNIVKENGIIYFYKVK